MRTINYIKNKCRNLFRNKKCKKDPVLVELSKLEGYSDPAAYMKYIHSQEVWEDIDVKIILNNYANISMHGFDNYPD